MFTLTYNNTSTDFDSAEQVKEYLQQLLAAEPLSVQDQQYFIFEEMFDYELLDWTKEYTGPSHLIESGSTSFSLGLKKTKSPVVS